MAERLAGFCEAILDISDVCASNMKCCVSKQMFNDGNTPSELVIPNRNKVSSSSQNQKPEVTTTSSPRSEPTAAPDQNQKAPAGSCQGTCVTGFFALLCDEIDRKADCPGNGRCCLTKKVGNRPSPPPITAKCPGFCLPQSMSSLCTKPSNILHNTKSCNKGTVCCESREPGQNAVERTPPPTIRTTTKRPAPRPTQRPQRPAGGGGGPDLSSLLLSAAPSILAAATGNSDAGTTAAALLPVLGSVLGGSSGGGGLGALLGGGAAPNRNDPPSKPDQGAAPAGGGAGGLVASLLPTLVGTFLGGGGGGAGGQQQQRIPQRPPFRPPVPTPAPTQPPTTTEPADVRPDCPGTCIASYLSFTCFGKFVKNHHVYHTII